MVQDETARIKLRHKAELDECEKELVFLKQKLATGDNPNYLNMRIPEQTNIHMKPIPIQQMDIISKQHLFDTDSKSPNLPQTNPDKIPPLPKSLEDEELAKTLSFFNIAVISSNKSPSEISQTTFQLPTPKMINSSH